MWLEIYFLYLTHYFLGIAYDYKKKMIKIILDVATSITGNKQYISIDWFRIYIHR